MAKDETNEFINKLTLNNDIVSITGALSRNKETARLCSGGVRILDLGCGTGELINQLAGKYEEVYGVDSSDSALNEAVRKGYRIAKIDLDNETLPFADNWFDTVVTLDVIEHVYDPLSFIKELSRVLRPDGELIISTPNIRFWKHIFNLMILGRFPKTTSVTEVYDGGHIHFFTFSDISHLLGGNYTVVHKSGICVAPSWKRRLSLAITSILGPKFQLEFMQHSILVKAIKKNEKNEKV
ncbi:MAG: methionine biosynthesis protein MetW [Pelobacteraceae bacterium]